MDYRRKCLATGKVSFENLIEARVVMFMLKWGHKRHRDLNGKRVKHRQGKPVQKRAYYCPHCKGYHITRWSKNHFNSYKEWLENELGDHG